MNRTGASREPTRSKGAKPARGVFGSKGAAAPATGKAEGASARSPKRLTPPKKNGFHDDEIELISARPSRAERADAEERMRRIDEVCAAWAAIIAERMAADQQFAELYEAYRTRSRDLRGLFAWDALHAAEAQLALINSALARFIGEDGRADPRAILADLRWEQRKLAAVYAINAFLAVLNQMSPRKARWLNLEEFDPRIAVLSLAHQTLGYALGCLRLPDPGDLTDKILAASQHESVWEVGEDDGGRAFRAARAAAWFFQQVGASELTTAEEVLTLYTTRARARS